jgi:putative ABC transport system permease protein
MILGLSILIVLISLGGGFINGLRLLKIQSKSLFRSLSQNKIQGNRLLRSLVILQFTISLSMLIFAFTIYSQLKFIQKKDVGFDKDQLISVRLFDESKMKLFENLEQFLVELRSFAAIQDVTFSCSSPAIINTSAGEAEWDGKNAGESLTVQWNSIFYNYFTTIGVPIVAGRNFSENFENELGGDDHAVYILNEAAVRGMNLKNEEAWKKF